MIYKLLACSLGLLLIQTAFAQPPKPEKCPSVAAVAAAGVDDASNSFGWIAFLTKPSSYDTKEKWNFDMLVPASSKKEALKVARANIGSLLQPEGPSYNNGTWGCVYSSHKQDIFGVALTPPSNFKIAVRNFV